MSAGSALRRQDPKAAWAALQRLVPPSRRQLPRRVRYALAWHPEWPIALLALTAWAALLSGHETQPGPTFGSEASAFFCALGGESVSAATGAPWVGALSGWAMMSTAMMVPSALPAARFVGLNSVRRRRLRAIAIFVAAYLSPWLLLGAALIVVVAPNDQPSSPPLIAVVLLVAAAWQLTRWKRRAVLGCPRVLALPPRGLRADVACARFGGRHALRCGLSSWPLLLLMVLVGHQSVLTMAALTAVMVSEEHLPSARKALRPMSAVLVVAAVGVFFLNHL